MNHDGLIISLRCLASSAALRNREQDMTSSHAAPRPIEGRESNSTGIVTVGLAVGGVLGSSGSLVSPGAVQDTLYAVSAVGLILAATLLALEHAAARRRLAAAGFALLALGETRLVNPTDAPGADASFAAGVMLYAPGLLLISLSSWAPRWVRATGAAAAVVFAAHALVYFGGGTVDSTGPLAAIGYGLLTVTVAGWAITVLRSPRAQATPADPNPPSVPVDTEPDAE
jgi:hypothetical protein